MVERGNCRRALLYFNLKNFFFSFPSNSMEERGTETRAVGADWRLRRRRQHNSAAVHPRHRHPGRRTLHHARRRLGFLIGWFLYLLSPHCVLIGWFLYLLSPRCVLIGWFFYLLSPCCVLIGWFLYLFILYLFISIISLLCSDRLLLIYFFPWWLHPCFSDFFLGRFFVIWVYLTGRYYNVHLDS